MSKQITLNDSEINFLKNNIGASKYSLSILKKLDKKRIKVSSAKAKGRNLQKWVCEKLANMIGIVYDQSDDQCEIHSREMGQRGVDIVLRGKAKELLPLAIECKNTEKLSLNEVIRQAKENEGMYDAWMVVHKNKTLENPIVIIDWDFFEHLLLKEVNLRKKENE